MFTPDRCPLCGGDSGIKREVLPKGDTRYFIQCKKCNIRIEGYKDLTGALNKWKHLVVLSKKSPDSRHNS